MGVAALAAALAGLVGSAPAALAATTDTWTGLEPATSSPVGNWQAAANWSAGVPVKGDILSFPRLANCDSSGFACFTTIATTSITAANLSIADDEPYSLGASNGITLTLDPLTGDGLDAATTGSALGSPYVAVPLVLGDSQHWSVAGNGAGSGGLAIGSVVGASVNGAPTTDKLAVTLSGGAQLYFDGTVGPDGLTVTGTGASSPAQNGLVAITNNAGTASGNSPIDVVDAALLLGNYAGAQVKTGSVTLQGSTLTVGGSGSNGPGRIAVSGAMSIDSASSTSFELEGTGTTLGSDYGQLVASGNVTLGGQLALTDEGVPAAVCPAATLGSSDTFLSTTGGTVTGAFSNLPNGAITSFTAHCGGGTWRYPVRIGYTPTAVTGTFVAPTATSTTLAASPASSVAGSNVTFTATVTPSGPGAGAPTGAVQFLDGTTPISCSTGGLLSGASPDVATCTTPGLPVGTDTVSAVYGGDGAWGGSTAAAVPVTVSPVPTPLPTTHGSTTATQRVAGSGIPRLGTLKVKAGTVRARVSCVRGGASCAARLQLATVELVSHDQSTERRTIVVGGSRITIAAGHRRFASLRLDAAGRRLLAHRHVLRITVILQHPVGHDVSTVASRKLTLRAGAHRHHTHRRR